MANCHAIKYIFREKSWRITRPCTYQRFYVKEENVTLRVLRVASEALDHQRRAFGFDLISVIRAVSAVQLLQLMQPSLRRVSDR